LNQAVFLEAAGAVMKIGSSLKTNHHRKTLLAQIRETLCSSNSSTTATTTIAMSADILVYGV